MSEEEKEAIKETKQVIEKWNDTNWLISYDHKNLEILLNLIDKLQKENQKLRDVKNKAIGHINCCKTSLGNYLLSPSEVECLLDILKEGDIE